MPIGDLLNLEPNKVSVDLSQYASVWTGDTGVGKTMAMMIFLKSISSGESQPLFIEFEDRFQNIPGIMAVKINTMSEFKQLIGQLKNPKAKEKFSCLVVDTIDKFEEFCEQYVLENGDAEILKDVGGFGEGHSRFKSSLRHIGLLQRLGYTVHGIAQSAHVKDFDTKLESDGMKLNKNTFSYFREYAYLIGYMWKEIVDGKEERFITFKKTSKLPDLKDTFGLPDKINVKDLKEVWTRVIEDLGQDFVTKNKTIDKEVKQDISFDEIRERGNKLGSTLCDAGHVEDAMAVLKKHIGIDDDGNIKMFNSLRESQIELMKIIVMEYEELVKKFKLN